VENRKYDQYELVIEVLNRLNASGVLKYLIFIGSWCLPLYRDYFGDDEPLPAIRTRDMDFLIPEPPKIHDMCDVPALIRDLGFVVTFRGQHGLIRLEHPDLMIEFLVPERGKGSDRPVAIPQLKVNAERLRFLSLLEQKTIRIATSGLSVVLPHPANFALQKLLICSRRRDSGKKQKDRDAATAILHALIRKDEKMTVIKVFRSLPLKWQKKILLELEESMESDLRDILSTTSTTE